MYRSYDYDTNEFSDQIVTTTSGISVNDTVYAKVIFDGAAPDNAYVTYLWQYMQENGGYSGYNYNQSDLPFSIDLASQVSEYVSDNHVKLTISGFDKYSTGEATIEFYVEPYSE